MKLIKCYIENFGKLSGCTYEFVDGCNTLFKQNGYGKTTLAVFLKAMFYGLANSGKTSVAVNERKHYAPWQGGAFGGTLLFEKNGKRYLIERFFGEKDKDETFVLYDADTNLESKDYSSKIGEELFLLDREAFEKSVYIPQQSLQTGVNDSISAKLSNLAENENDMNHFELAKANLEKEQKELMRTGERGKIWELRRIVSELERKVKELDSVTDNERLWNEKRQKVERSRKEAEEKLAFLTEELKRVSEYEHKMAKMTHYQALKEKFLNSQARLERHQLFFPEAMRDNIEAHTGLEKYFTAITAKNEYASHVSVLEVKRATLVKERQSIEQEALHLRQVYEKADKTTVKQKKVFLPYVGAVLLAILGFGCFFVQKIFGVVFLLTGITVMAMLLVSSQKQAHLEKEALKKSKQYKQELIRKLKEIEKAGVEMDAGFLACEEEIAETKRLLYEEEEKLTTFFRQFEAYKNIEEVEYMTALSEIKEKAAVYISLREEVLEQYKSVKQFESENLQFIFEQKQQEEGKNTEKISMDVYENVHNRTVEDIQMEQNEWYRKLQNLIEEQSQIQRQLERLSLQLEQREEISCELAYKREELSEYESKYELLVKTIKYLEKAKELFSTRYVTKLQDSFLNYLEILNEEISGEFVVDTKLKLKVTKGGKKKELDYFSAGYRDLLNLCLRFAMVDALYEKETPFLILDDPFVNMDEEKLKRALDFVKRLSDKHQIIYFTCHESRIVS